jgi:hypothetical protein
MLSCTALLAADEPKDYKFSVHQKDYRFSTVFELDGDGSAHGSVIKSSFRVLKHLRDAYDLYDEEGNWYASGVGRIACLGLFTPWGAEFDVYDKNGVLIGYIDGQVMTTETAKYSIYDAYGERKAIAYLDRSHAGIAIVHPEKTSKIYARLVRNFVKDQIDHWDVSVYKANTVDPTILKVFAAFAVDYQEYFKIDN